MILQHTQKNRECVKTEGKEMMMTLSLRNRKSMGLGFFLNGHTCMIKQCE